MAPTPSWIRIATDPVVLRRGALTSIIVGTVLTIANHGSELVGGTMQPTAALPILITYLVPFGVSCLTSAFVVRRQRGLGDASIELLEREVAAINKYPGQNPNPVIRVTEDGRMTYANGSSAPIRAGLGVDVGATIDAPTMTRIKALAAEGGTFEVTHGRQTFAVLPVHAPELGAYNVYGTDITAAKLVARFPDRNTNPVLRMSPTGVLQYANPASRPITGALGLEVGTALPGELFAQLQASLADPPAAAPEVSGEGGRTYRLTPVPIPEFEFVNLYGTEITAEKAIDRIPSQNPNPVLRLSRNGQVTFANAASEPVRRALGAETGNEIEPVVFARLLAAGDDPEHPTIDLEAGDRTFRLRVVSMYEYDAVNVYGTDITAARQVERLNAENERLLLSILPASIAERLRGGEQVIADNFEDMTVLFADLVSFTELASGLPASEVVRLLNDVFSMCDDLADHHHLEKIKTVGDAYMVVGGFRETAAVHAAHSTGDGASAETDDGVVHATHPSDVADMGLAMLEGLAAYAQTTGLDLHMRVGMHVGPAVAGVIGLKRFIYDVWGDTVNTASRMESTGVPGRIQVTGSTHERLKADFELEPRGRIAVKGKGEIETWLLVGRRDATI